MRTGSRQILSCDGESDLGAKLVHGGVVLPVGGRGAGDEPVVQICIPASSYSVQHWLHSSKVDPRAVLYIYIMGILEAINYLEVVASDGIWIGLSSAEESSCLILRVECIVICEIFIVGRCWG